MPKIKSITPKGIQQTFDIEVDHKDHQFYTKNGLLTSNSHAISYSIDSYMCAWLMTYFEPEWLCAYIEARSGDPDKKRSAITELKSIGYEIVKVDINYATSDWTIIPGKKFMPSLLSVKGVGEKAIEEVIANRPYRDIYDFLWDENGKWKHSKFNKRCRENLIKIGAFDSMDVVGEGKLFSSYRHMHHVLVENDKELKSVKKGRDNFERIRLESYNIEPWSKEEKIEMSKELLGSVDFNLLMSQHLQQKLSKLNVLSIDEFAEVDKNKDTVWFILSNAIKRTSKKGNTYLKLEVIAQGGKNKNIFCWGWNEEDGNFPRLNIPYVAEVEKWDGGFSTNLKKMRAIIEGGK